MAVSASQNFVDSVVRTHWSIGIPPNGEQVPITHCEGYVSLAHKQLRTAITRVLCRATVAGGSVSNLNDLSGQRINRFRGKGRMIDRPNADPTPDNRPQPERRKPWHMPQFIVTDLGSTDTMCNGGLDGGPIGSES
jgi:hypothetical protein